MIYLHNLSIYIHSYCVFYIIQIVKLLNMDLEIHEYIHTHTHTMMYSYNIQIIKYDFIPLCSLKKTVFFIT